MKGDKKVKRIVLYGGKFDPPTDGHLNVIAKVCRYVDFDEFYVVPSYKSYLDNKDIRIMMAADLVLSTKCYVNQKVKDLITLSTVEMDEEITHTIDTINYFDKFGKNDIYVVIGLDQANAIETWYKYKELMKLVKFIVTNRIGYHVKPDAWYTKDPHIFIPEYPEHSNISSTLVRNLVKIGNPRWIKMVSFRIQQIIENFSLYR